MGGSVLPHHVTDRLFQSVQGQLKHREDFANLTDGSSIGPFFGLPGAEYTCAGIREENEGPVRGLNPIVYIKHLTAFAVDA